MKKKIVMVMGVIAGILLLATLIGPSLILKAQLGLVVGSGFLKSVVPSLEVSLRVFSNVGKEYVAPT